VINSLSNRGNSHDLERPLMSFANCKPFRCILPVRRYLARVLAVVVCLYVCMSVCLSHAGIVSKRLKRGITQTTSRDSPWNLVFWRQESLLDDLHSSWNLRLNWPTPFRTQRFR